MTRIVAHFDSPEAVERAAREAARAGWRTVEICAPALDERLLTLAHATKSPVATAGLAGGIIGLLSGFLLTVGTVRQWPGLIVSGKPLVSVPPFLIIIFELTILMASLAAFATFLTASVGARRLGGAAWDQTTTDNAFALLIEIDNDVPSDVVQRLQLVNWRRV